MNLKLNIMMVTVACFLTPLTSHAQLTVEQQRAIADGVDHGEQVANGGRGVLATCVRIWNGPYVRGADGRLRGRDGTALSQSTYNVIGGAARGGYWPAGGRPSDVGSLRLPLLPPAPPRMAPADAVIGPEAAALNQALGLTDREYQRPEDSSGIAGPFWRGANGLTGPKGRVSREDLQTIGIYIADPTQISSQSFDQGLSDLNTLARRGPYRTENGQIVDLNGEKVLTLQERWDLSRP